MIHFRGLALNDFLEMKSTINAIYFNICRSEMFNFCLRCSMRIVFADVSIKLLSATTTKDYQGGQTIYDKF